MDNTYRKVKDTPLKWHRFMQFFIIPVCIILCVYALICYGADLTGISLSWIIPLDSFLPRETYPGGYWITLAAVILQLILLIRAFAGSFHWIKSSYHSLQLHFLIGFLYTVYAFVYAYENELYALISANVHTYWKSVTDRKILLIFILLMVCMVIYNIMSFTYYFMRRRLYVRLVPEGTQTAAEPVRSESVNAGPAEEEAPKEKKSFFARFTKHRHIEEQPKETAAADEANTEETKTQSAVIETSSPSADIPAEEMQPEEPADTDKETAENNVPAEKETEEKKPFLSRFTKKKEEETAEEKPAAEKKSKLPHFKKKQESEPAVKEPEEPAPAPIPLFKEDEPAEDVTSPEETSAGADTAEPVSEETPEDETPVLAEEPEKTEDAAEVPAEPEDSGQSSVPSETKTLTAEETESDSDETQILQVIHEDTKPVGVHEEKRLDQVTEPDQTRKKEETKKPRLYCPVCGARIKYADAEFCSVCGARLK